jgi:glycine/D-amino acid oxidase-like deaminating enzyme
MIVVGSDIVGFSVALQLKKNKPSLGVTLLEAGFLPTAARKNAGFACFGSVLEALNEIKAAWRMISY